MHSVRTVRAVAHRGDPYRFRENTLPSLRSALERGADAVEIDVRLTRDGVPVLLHDATLERLWEHERPLAALTAAEVREVTAGGVPTLAEALEAVQRWRPADTPRPVDAPRPTDGLRPADVPSPSGGQRSATGGSGAAASAASPASAASVASPASAADEAASAAGGPPAAPERRPGRAEQPRVLVDLPDASPAAVRRILAVVRECGAADRAYYCGGPRTLLALRAADEAAETALTWTTLAPPRPALLAAVAPRWLNYRFSLVDEAVAARVHRSGHLLSVWTPDTGRSVRRLIRLGVDAITTNRIDVLRAARDRRAQRAAAMP